MKCGTRKTWRKAPTCLPSAMKARSFELLTTQYIEIGRGSLGTVGGTPIPEASAVLNQGGKTFVTSGTTLVQPISQLFTRVKPANDAAQADLNASQADARDTLNQVSLKVHQIYYKLLIAGLRGSAAEARIRADQDLPERTSSAGEVRQRARRTIDRESRPSTAGQARIVDHAVADFRPDHATQ